MRFIVVLSVLVPVFSVHAQSPADMEPGTWLEIPNTPMGAVAPQLDDFPGTWGVIGPRGVIDAWNGAALDTTRGRLLLHGGGHNDYWGNEIYSFEVSSLSWERLTDPTPNPPSDTDIWNGAPQSRHTYSGQTYIASLDQFFVLGGSGSTNGGDFPPTENVWTYDFGSQAWSYVNTPYPVGPPGGEGSAAIYDPQTGLVWWGDGTNSNPGDRWGLYSYDPRTQVWTHHDNSLVYSGRTGCIAVERGLLIFAGRDQLIVADIRADPPTVERWETTGANSIIEHSAPGIDYDPIADRVLAWDGGPVHVLDLDTREWQVIDAPGAPTEVSTGTFTRFRYVPSVNAFISVNGLQENVFFFKNAPGLGMPLPDPPDPRDAGTPDASTTSDANPPPPDAGADANNGLTNSTDGGCDCSTTPNSPSPLWLPALLVWFIARRRTA